MDESAIRDVLNAERAATLARIRAMQADLDAIVDASANVNTDDEHDPEGSTIAYERAQVAALLAGAQTGRSTQPDGTAYRGVRTQGRPDRQKPSEGWLMDIKLCRASTIGRAADVSSDADDLGLAFEGHEGRVRIHPQAQKDEPLRTLALARLLGPKVCWWLSATPGLSGPVRHRGWFLPRKRGGTSALSPLLVGWQRQGHLTVRATDVRLVPQSDGRSMERLVLGRRTGSRPARTSVRLSSPEGFDNDRYEAALGRGETDFKQGSAPRQNLRSIRPRGGASIQLMLRLWTGVGSGVRPGALGAGDPVVDLRSRR